MGWHTRVKHHLTDDEGGGRLKFKKSSQKYYK